MVVVVVVVVVVVLLVVLVVVLRRLTLALLSVRFSFPLLSPLRALTEKTAGSSTADMRYTWQLGEHAGWWHDMSSPLMAWVRWFLMFYVAKVGLLPDAPMGGAAFGYLFFALNILMAASPAPAAPAPAAPAAPAPAAPAAPAPAAPAPPPAADSPLRFRTLLTPPTALSSTREPVLLIPPGFLK